MSRKNIIFAITNGVWLIDKHSAEMFGENLASYFQGKNFWTDDHKAKAEFLIIGAGTNQQAESYFSTSLSKAPADSVAVIDINGPIMKYDSCGDPGTKSYESMISQINSNPNLLGAVLQISSPGGTVEGTESLATAIKNSKKPIVTLAEDIMASAAYWIGSSSKKVFIKTQTTILGSIGTVSEIRDYTEAWKAKGIVIHEVYASASTEKNSAFAEVIKGNKKPLQDEIIDPLNNAFLNAVKANRPNIDAKALAGKTFQGQDAIKMGLADAFGTLQDAIDSVHELAGDTSYSQNLNQNQNMKKVTLTAAHAAIIALCGVTLEAGKDSVEVEMTDEVIGKINSALVAAEKATTDLTTANASLKTAQDELATAKTSLAKAQDDYKTLSESNPGAITPKKEGNDDLGAEQSDSDKEVWELSHNKAVLDDPMFN